MSTQDTAVTIDSQDLHFFEHLKTQWMGMIDAIEDPLALIDENFNIRRQNRAYVERAVNPHQLSIREFKGKKCYEAFAGRTAPCPHCHLQRAQNEGHKSTWLSRELFTGRDLEIRVSPNVDSSQGGRLSVVHYRDVTQQRSLQESLARADKLAALGKLAGGVAHEINSPLAGIMAFAQMALREMPDTDPHLEDMREIEAAAQKCKVIVEGLLGFARQDAPESTEIFDLVECVQSTLRLSRAIIRKERIELTLNTPHAPVSIEGSKGRLSQVILNLITNAVYAMRDGGGELEVSVQEPSDSSVVLKVRDTGTGISKEHLSRIFDPFFTTKPVGEGTGLGLAISYSIITQHRGKISAESSEGIGTTFTITLPCQGEQHSKLNGKSPTTGSANQTETNT
jgi:two-component system NtrC family sensor kinase